MGFFYGTQVMGLIGILAEQVLLGHVVMWFSVYKGFKCLKLCIWPVEISGEGGLCSTCTWKNTWVFYLDCGIQDPVGMDVAIRAHNAVCITK